MRMFDRTIRDDRWRCDVAVCLCGGAVAEISDDRILVARRTTKSRRTTAAHGRWRTGPFRTVDDTTTADDCGSPRSTSRRSKETLATGLRAACPISRGRARSRSGTARTIGKTRPHRAACLWVRCLRHLPGPRKIIQTPGLLVILNERDFSYRQIFTDGRPLPNDPNPSWYATVRSLGRRHARR